jgi:hypothetical protein
LVRGRDDVAVRQELAAIIEDDHTVAEPAPALVPMLGLDPRPSMIG